MKKVSLKCKVILTILPLLFGLIIFYPSAITVVSENQIASNNNELMTSQDAIFDGLYLNYTFTISGAVSGFSNFSYSHISGMDYDVYWDTFAGDTEWDENLGSRVINNSGGVFSFIDGTHAPLWIFTNSTLGQVILIAAGASGDHPFNITRDFAYNLPGFGTIDVWQLEDLSFPGGIALYEKSTGFLIKGFFPVVPAFNYTLEIITTNLIFDYTTPDSGIIDGLYIAHNYTVSSMIFKSNFSFSEDPIGTYNVTWDVALLGSFSWNEYIANRRIFNTGSSGFHDFSHTLVWIQTNVGLSDIVPITVGVVGDQNYTITGQLVHKIAGFGYVEVWVLQNLLYPLGEVWYEKSTGLLLKGTFIWGGGNYTLEFLDTNADFTYVGSPDTSKILGYNHFLLIGLLIIVPIIIIRIKKRK